MENPTHSSREKNLVLYLIKQSQVNSKCDELELSKGKRGHFLYRVLSQYIVY